MNLTVKETEKEFLKIELKIESLIKVCTDLLNNIKSFEIKSENFSSEDMHKIKIMMFMPIFLTIREELVEMSEFSKKD